MTQAAGTLAHLRGLANRRGDGPAVILVGNVGRALPLSAAAAPADPSRIAVAGR